MTLDSSNETVAILYDIENAPFEMLNYTLGKARRYQPCRTIVVSDWEARPEQKRWDKLMRRPGFTFRQISRTYHGKNSLDSAIYDSAKILYQEGVRKFLIITTDSDFVRIAELLNSDTPSYIIGVGTKQASETLRNAYNEFFVYPPEEKKKPAKKTAKADKQETKKAEIPAEKAVTEKAAPAKKKAAAAKTEAKEKPAVDVKTAKAAKPAKTAAAKTATAKAAAAKETKEKTAAPKMAPAAASTDGLLSVKLPKSLRRSLEERKQEEGVSLDELVTYLIMRGLSR
ncbi:NYN domain-containing protein [Selenomonas ruminantium]|uniref:NYN domain-containing protein n=1 Tax=Selenomonas ruminantium TaxID=971 RepID=A0A1I3HYP6_SELRU|nr:NYN domain-containing protein [Selenomonas ruminantium]SFI40710.1 NYN domain-containing protein [Selenomonas ruminantium]